MKATTAGSGRFRCDDGCFVAAAEVTGSPVELPQAFQDRALDAMLSVGGKRHFLFGVELCGGIEKSQHAGVNEIIQVRVGRQVPVQAHGDSFHHRTVLQDDAIEVCNIARRESPGFLDLRYHVGLSNCKHRSIAKLSQSLSTPVDFCVDPREDIQLVQAVNLPRVFDIFNRQLNQFPALS
jgi:hypothetical protein